MVGVGEVGEVMTRTSMKFSRYSRYSYTLRGHSSLKALQIRRIGGDMEVTCSKDFGYEGSKLTPPEMRRGSSCQPIKSKQTETH
jgi:hypothetical protein